MMWDFSWILLAMHRLLCHSLLKIQTGFYFTTSDSTGNSAICNPLLDSNGYDHESNQKEIKVDRKKSLNCDPAEGNT
ncbi:hypothetical protein T10_7282 [Trichinella papuae]|uniref:Secreted protein n=1 Tax=Trichinella papuae TaxID=268474 RepID=A0A0V1M4R5_9BILA|nr:hypothetical protein T10_12080 [Trichinella papuae]KRZ66549.1 hypothetical protein T10_7282 [Trichinella papuae]